MSKSFDRIAAAAREAVKVSKGEEPAAPIFHNGFSYVPKAECDKYRDHLFAILDATTPSDQVQALKAARAFKAQVVAK